MDRIRTADVLAEAPSFRDLLLPTPILKSLEAAGYLRPSPVQHAAIPLTRLGLDVIIQAKAGTGKTLVFAITITESIDRSATFPQALVLAPTREVALQAADVITEAAAGTRSPALSVATLIGGLPTAEDERILRRKCHVIVGTPGRILSLIQRGSLVTQGISMLVLDEADKLLSSDFSEVVHQVIAAIPVTRQILALSATYTPSVAEQLKELMHQPHEVMLCAETTSLLGIAHYYKDVAAAAAGGRGGTSSAVSSDEKSRISPESTSIKRVDTYIIKRRVLLDVLSSISFHQAVIFCNSKATADTLSENLITAGHAAACLSSDKDQLQRIDILNSLRSFGLRIVVATDVAARGIDLDRVNLVVNFDVPAAPATLMHRVGRAGRFGTRGTAISLVYGNAEKDDLKRAVVAAAGGNVFPLPDELPIGWSAAQLLDVAADNGKGYDEHQGVKEHVKVISNGVPSSSRVHVPFYGRFSGENPSDDRGSERSIDTDMEISKIISSVSLWPGEQGTPFPKPEGAWPLQLAELSPAMQGDRNMKPAEPAASSSLLPPTIVPQIEAIEPLSPLTSIFTHYSDIVKSLELDLQRTPESESETLAVLEQAFSFSGSTVFRRTTASLAEEDTDASEAVESKKVYIPGGHFYDQQQQPQVEERQRRPLGSAQVSAYTRQVAQEERDHTRALAEESALLESMATGDSSYFYDNDQYFERDDEFDENGYYKNPRGQRRINYQNYHQGHYDQQIAEKETETDNFDPVAMDSLANEAAWRQYWYDHYKQYGYWPGGSPTTSTVPVQPPSTLQIPSPTQILPPAASPAIYSVVTPGSATTATVTAASPSLPVEVGGWSPHQGTPPNTAAVVASCADQAGYVRVPAQILQRYLELEWQQWQNRFFGGGSSGGGMPSDV